MSLKYRLILLTVVVFAATFGGGTVLALHGARRLAEDQLHGRLQRLASDLAASQAPLNEEVLTRLAPLLGADLMIVDAQGRLGAHNRGDWPWASVQRALFPDGVLRPGMPGWVDVADRRVFFATARGRLPATREPVTVLTLSDAAAAREPARIILNWFLVVLVIAAMLCAAGTYLVGLAWVRRIQRLSRQVDQTLSEQTPPTPRRGGDEVRQLADAFDDLIARLEQSRRRLLAQQRLATTGKLASSVAHEVRNPLQAIRLTVQMMLEQSPADFHEGLGLILGEIDRLSLLTDELLVLAGKDRLRVEGVDVRRELDETLGLLRFQLRQREISAAVDLPDLPSVRMDRSRCRQLLLNLLLNAAEASPRGGVVRVSGEIEGGQTVLRVADSGAGFPAEVLAGSADEFFSTKSSGAGLGLSICRRIVAEAGGRLGLRNADGGAVAEVALPVAKPDGDADTC